MDPNPKSFPILSYILGPKPTQPPATELVDIEQPPEPESTKPDFAIKDPKLLSAMRTAVSEVVQARSVLEALGPRPDHEIVDAARAKLAELEAVGDDRKVEAEKSKYKAVVSLEEMHLAYEKMLKVAEEKLVRMYESGDGLGNDDDEEEEEEVEEEVNEEVVRVLQEATGNGLERVELAGKKLRILPEAFGRIHGLVVLNVFDNQLKALPDSIAGLQTLEELNVSSNILESLPDSIGLLQNLKSLNASGNKLSALPDTISACRSLVELDVSYNDLSYLPTNLGNELVNLQRLSIQLNKIRYLPTSVGEMKSLRILDAHFNELHGLPVTIGKLTNLEILNLGSNFADLKELPVTFGNLSNLRELDLSNNQIHALPDTFGLLEKLTKVNLDENPIAIPPLEVVKSGVEAIKAFMAKRRLDLLLEEEEKNKLEMQMKEPASPTAWLARSTSWLKSRVSDVSHNVAEFIGNAGKTGDPILDEER